MLRDRPDRPDQVVDLLRSVEPEVCGLSAVQATGFRYGIYRMRFGSEPRLRPRSANASRVCSSGPWTISVLAFPDRSARTRTNMPIIRGMVSP